MSGTERLENVNPAIYQRIAERIVTKDNLDDSVHEEFDDREIYGMTFVHS